MTWLSFCTQSNAIMHWLLRPRLMPGWQAAGPVNFRQRAGPAKGRPRGGEGAGTGSLEMALKRLKIEAERPELEPERMIMKRE